jgi:hypothetical protein
MNRAQERDNLDAWGQLNPAQRPPRTGQPGAAGSVFSLAYRRGTVILFLRP